MSWAEVVVAITALASAVLGGALFSFSTFVMQALGRLEPADGVRAMQRINEEAPRGLLMLPLLVSPLGSVVVGVLAVTGWGVEGTTLVGDRGLLRAVRHQRRQRLDGVSRGVPRRLVG